MSLKIIIKDLQAVLIESKSFEGISKADSYGLLGKCANYGAE